MRIVYFGTPTIAAHILECLLKHNINIVAVVTKPDKKQGRSQQLQPSAVKTFVQSKAPHIPILEPVKVSTEEYRDKLAAFNADLFVVVAYGEIVKQLILDIPKLKCINVHASLLPKYRGAAPMHRAIIQGEAETGITIMEMVLALDAGAILHVEKTPILENMTVGELEISLEKLGCQGLLKVFEDFQHGRVISRAQDERFVTYASKITTEECEVDWNRPSQVLHDLIRGVTPFPGAWCSIKMSPFGEGDKKRLKIKKALIVKDPFTGKSGDILKYDHDTWIVATQDGAIQLLEVQLEGKKACSASEFIRGYAKPKMA
ncbi:MAG: methionyl-tRNA formyltransferase [Chlamydiota bacterium]